MGRIQIIIVCATLALWVGVVSGSGCQHQCNCGFKWTDNDAADENTKLRYEVMGGLIGAFSPLAVAGIGYLILRKLNCSGPSSPSAGRKGTSPPWRDRPWSSSGKISPSGPRGSTPISLYGETEDSFLTSNSSLPNKFGNLPSIPGGAIPMPDSATPSGQYRNIHRNIPGNDVNQWFKNVNTAKY